MARPQKRVIVLGGGFAGLSAIVELRRVRADLEIHLIDGEKDHCRITCLHKTFHTPLEEFLTPFEKLGEKLSFLAHKKRVSFGLSDLDRWQDEKCLDLSGEKFPFDALIVATGSMPIELSGGPGVFDLSHLRQGRGLAILDDICNRAGAGESAVTFVGGGATGIQALFEAKSALNDRGFKGKIRLLSRSLHLVSRQPPKFHDYLLKRLKEADIEFVPQTTYLGQSRENILVKDLRSGKEIVYPSRWTFLFPGIKPSPLRFETNSCGQVLHGTSTLENVFAAGDCSFFLSSGLNHMTAQAAIQKGRLAARNVLARLENRDLKPYVYREKGFFISLGKADAIGWIGSKGMVVKGFSALAFKEAAESQFALFLGGINTYGFLS